MKTFVCTIFTFSYLLDERGKIIILFKYYSVFTSKSGMEKESKTCFRLFFAYEQLNNKGERMGKAGKAMSLLKLFITSDDQK